MAKPKKIIDPDQITYLGEDIDPNLQKKVEEYMEIDETEAAPEIQPDPLSLSEAEPASAPLLPTDKLPDGLQESGQNPKPKKIAVSEHVDTAETAPELAPTKETTPELPPSKKKSKKGIKIVPISEDTEEPEALEAVAALPEENSDESKPVEVTPDEQVEEPALESLPEEEPEDDTVQLSEEELTEIDPLEEPETPETEIPEEPVGTLDPELAAAPQFDQDQTIADLDKLPLDDSQTSAAIEEIIAEDADALLEANDEKKAAQSEEALPKAKQKKVKRENIFKVILKTPLYRNLLIGGLLLVVILAALLPGSRYFVLNTSGVRVSASMKVLDDSTSLPLKNAELVIDGKSNKTDNSGVAKVDGIRLGKQSVTIKKPGFADNTIDHTFGWGSNPMGDFRLKAVGTQFLFILEDFLSGKFVKNAEATFGEASANVNEKGEILLTIAKVEQDQIEVKISAESYREETVKVDTTKKGQSNLRMVPAAKHVFVSKRNGKLDLYKVDADGKNEQVVLAGTGIEKEDSLGVAPHPTKNKTAFVSTRENVRNKDKFLLSTLNIVDLDSGVATKVTQSERIQLIDWVGDRLVYVKVAEGASEGNINRHRLMSYDIEANTEKELASTNYFNDVISVDGAIYYTPALYQVNGQVGLYKINADGTGKKTIFAKEVWNLFRTSFDKVSLSVGQDWYELNLTNDSIAKIGGAPPVLRSRVYISSLDKKQYLWIDERDGKTVLLSYQVDTKEDKQLQSKSGIKNPIRWLDNDHIIYRVSNGQETADYVMSLSGGIAVKVKDVTNTAGIDRWYYY